MLNLKLGTELEVSSDSIIRCVVTEISELCKCCAESSLVSVEELFERNVIANIHNFLLVLCKVLPWLEIRFS